MSEIANGMRIEILSRNSRTTMHRRTVGRLELWKECVDMALIRFYGFSLFALFSVLNYSHGKCVGHQKLIYVSFVGHEFVLLWICFFVRLQTSNQTIQIWLKKRQQTTQHNTNRNKHSSLTHLKCNLRARKWEFCSSQKTAGKTRPKTANVIFGKFDVLICIICIVNAAVHLFCVSIDITMPSSNRRNANYSRPNYT